MCSQKPLAQNFDPPLKAWHLVVWWLVAAAFGFEAGAALAAPFVPTQDSQVLERLRAPGDPQYRALRRLRQQLAQDPQNLELALQLARRYRERGRAEGAPRYYGYAQAALRPWWDLAQPPPSVLVMRAILRQAQHDFTGALDDLSQVLQVEPYNAQAWLTRATILKVRGEYEEALRSCTILSRLANALMATACASSVASLSGRAEWSYQRLQKALDRSPSARAQERLWALTILAEIAARLDFDNAAEQYFTEALGLGLRNTYLLEAFADFLLDRDRPQKVISLLKDDTKPDGLLLRLTLAERRLDAPQLTMHSERLRARFAATRRRGGTVHLRNEVRFMLEVLDQPKEALALAQKNWQQQREPWDTRLLLEAALKTSNVAAAKPAIDWLKAVRLEDVSLHRLIERLEAMRP